VLKTEHSYQYCGYSRKPREVQQSDNMKPGRYLRSVHWVCWDFYRYWPILTASFSNLFALLPHPASFKLLFLDGTTQCTVKVDLVLIRCVYFFLVTEERDWAKDRCHSTYRMWTTTNQWQWFSLHFTTWLRVATSLLQVESSWWHKTTRYVWIISLCSTNKNINKSTLILHMNILS